MATIQRARKENKSVNVTIFSTTSNSYVSLSSNTFTLTVKTSKDSDTTDASAIIKKSTYVTSGTIGTIILTSTDTDITPKKYVFDVWREEPNGNIRQILEGDFIITQPVNNDI